MLTVNGNSYTPVVVKIAEGGYAAYALELSGANTQGETIEEARANLEEAITLVLEVQQELQY